MCGYTGIVARVTTRHTSGQDEHGAVRLAAGGRTDIKGEGCRKLSFVCGCGAAGHSEGLAET